MRTPAVLVAVLVASALGLACSSSTDPTPGISGDGGTKTRSFRGEVVPLLNEMCGTSACHGDRANANVGVYFIPGDANGTFTELQKEAPSAPGAKLVVPGDPAKSFLYAKMVGKQGDFAAQCRNPGCGDTMPPNVKLTADRQAIVGDWISQGAKDE